MFGVVVNTFLTESHPPSVRLSAQFAVSLLKNCPEVTTVVLVDGSAQPDPAFEKFCADAGVHYAHFGEPLSFAEAYNRGAALLTEDWIALMASDVYVLPTTFSRFKQFIERHSNLAIGCLIPYLSRSDFPVQQALDGESRPICRVPTMTINLNVFPRRVFENVLGLSESYTGNYNDVDLGIRLRQKGLDLFLINAYAHHYGSLTLGFGSNARLENDKKSFFNMYPEFWAARGFWNIRLDYLIDRWYLKITYRIALFSFSDTVRNWLSTWIFRQIPYAQEVLHKSR